MEWTVEPGIYNILIGSSSADIRLQGTIDMTKLLKQQVYRTYIKNKASSNQ
jgi:hypothetical protein